MPPPWCHFPICWGLLINLSQVKEGTWERDASSSTGEVIFISLVIHCLSISYDVLLVLRRKVGNLEKMNNNCFPQEASLYQFKNQYEPRIRIEATFFIACSHSRGWIFVACFIWNGRMKNNWTIYFSFRNIGALYICIWCTLLSSIPWNGQIILWHNNPPFKKIVVSLWCSLLLLSDLVVPFFVLFSQFLVSLSIYISFIQQQ